MEIKAKKAKLWEDFQTVYSYENEDEELEQRLAITWITEDSIEFRIWENNMTCDSELFGTAITFLEWTPK